MKAYKKYLAEFLGTMVLVVFGCGVAIVTGCGTETGGMAAYLATAVAFGLVIVAMAYSIGHISGCHINPAVSIAMLVSRKMTLKDFIGYVIAQCLGAIAGAAILYLIFGLRGGFGTNDLVSASTPAIAIGKSLAVEIMLTAVFVFAILGVTSSGDFSRISGVVIGFSLILVHLLGIGLTGTSVNPARSLGPALFKGGSPLCNLWVFIVGPLVGGVLAAIVWRFLAGKKEQ
ncbi:MAG: MIP family channel protein [Oscillospiraceae bacterium]|nr:MIP family channel protein [Oscillospiraceae bacterium]